jgi:hypothetical protein
LVAPLNKEGIETLEIRRGNEVEAVTKEEASAFQYSQQEGDTLLDSLRIPDDADQRSGLMPITHSGRCRSVIPVDADQSFRGDPDQ